MVPSSAGADPAPASTTSADTPASGACGATLGGHAASAPPSTGPMMAPLLPCSYRSCASGVGQVRTGPPPAAGRQNA